MNRTTRKHDCAWFAAFLAAVCAAQAQTTWTGNSGTTWSDGGNWDTGTAPGTADTAVFDNASAPNAPRVTATATIDGMQLAVDQEFKIDTKSSSSSPARSPEPAASA